MYIEENKQLKKMNAKEWTYGISLCCWVYFEFSAGNRLLSWCGGGHAREIGMTVLLV